MTPSIGLNLRVTGHCNQGGRKYMEDAFVVAYQQSEDQKDLEYAYFGIFDGHGGREAALFAKEHLMNNIVSQKAFWSDDDKQVLKAIRAGFLTTHHAMWREVGNWPKTVSGQPSTSGTTSSIAFIRRNKLYIGHVGDSRIVLGFQLPGQAEWCAWTLTKDHKPETPEEKLRINSVGGLVLNKAGVERVVWNRPRPGHKGPVRRSTPFDHIPFLAVARSLGDFWSYNYLRHKFVVSPDPDVKVININPHTHRCVLFASDGLWNMLTAMRAVKIVQAAEEENEKLILEGNKTNGSGKQPNNPSKLLVDAALKHWYDLGMRADNTSVVTVMLDPPGPPKSKVLLRQKVMKRLRPRDEQLDESGDGKTTNEMDKSASPSCKEKRKATDSTESQHPNRKRKKSSDSFNESMKEKKLANSDEAVPRNLPQPVILSPQRVAKHGMPSPPKHNQENETVKRPVPIPTTSPVPTVYDKDKKSDNDPPGGGTCIDKEEEKSDIPRDEALAKSTLTENTNEKVHSNPSLARSESCVTKCDGSSSPKCPNYSSSKENNMVHLCQAFSELFHQMDNKRITESNSSNQKVVSSRNKAVPPTVKNFRKSTLLRRTSNVLRPRRNFSACRTSQLRQSYAHNTRAHSGIRKLKV